jgi:predicted phage tail protein
LQFPFTTRRIKIVPIVAGAGGAGRILAGIALIAASIFLPGSTPFLVKLMAGVQSLGVSLVLGGISQLLFSPPKVSQPNEASEDTPNYSFNGAVNTLAQGQCVPVLYGRLIVGGATVSFGIHLEGVNEVYQPEFDPALIAPMRTFTNQVNNALFGFATLAVGFNGSQRE